jgi:hypothetical protein
VGEAALFGASLRIAADDGRVLVETNLALTKGGSMPAVFVRCLGAAELRGASITAQYNYEHTATTLLLIAPSEWP